MEYGYSFPDPTCLTKFPGRAILQPTAITSSPRDCFLGVREVMGGGAVNNRHRQWRCGPGPPCPLLKLTEEDQTECQPRPIINTYFQSNCPPWGSATSQDEVSHLRV